MKVSPILATLALLALPAMTSAQDSDPFAEALGQSVLQISMTDDSALAGDGHRALLDEAAGVHFFLVGEQHAAREIALVETALQRDLAEQDFGYMVVELGPWSTREVERLIRSGDGALAAHIRTPGQQFHFPFVFFEEEAALVEQAVALSPHGEQVLWGVDQEFIGAGAVLAEQLTALAESDEQRAAAARFAAGVAANPMYLGTADTDEMVEIVNPFLRDRTSEGFALATGIEQTWRIYGAFTRGAGPIYTANLERENLMKRQFLAHFAAAEARNGEPPRAFFKFGAFHLERGLSGTDVPSFGNFLMEWGRARDLRSVNLMIDCLGGETWGIQQGSPEPCENYAGLDTDSPLFAAMGEARMALFDLRSLRPHLNRARDLDPRLRRLILAYDYYLVIRDVTPQTPLADIRPPAM